MDRDPFIATLTDGIPARPLNMTAIEATNRGVVDARWAMLTATPDVPVVGIEEVAGRSPGTLLIDVREPEEYAHGHVPGAINLPQAELATRLAEVPQDRPVMMICQSGYRSLRSAQFLAQMGYDKVATVTGGTAAWRASGRTIDTGDTRLDAPRVIESEWAHAGASYVI
jgi:rhodanese-related sulfurtransferase